MSFGQRASELLSTKLVYRRFRPDVFSAADALANATICRFCGCVCRKWIRCWAVRTGMPRSLRTGTRLPYGSISLIRSSASYASPA